MVPDCTGGEFHAVAHQVILIGHDGEGVHLSPVGLFQDLQFTDGHGEGVVAELQLTGLLADLIHGEVGDPAERVPFLIHMLGGEGGEHLDEYAGGLLGRQLFPGGQAHKGIGFQAQGRNHGLLPVL